MKEFLTQHFEWIIGIIVVCIFAYQAIRALKKAKKIEQEGIETDAVVSRIEETWDEESHSSSYTTYVEYTDKEGMLRESAMVLTSQMEYTVGQHVRIRYVQGITDMVRAVKD